MPSFSFKKDAFLNTIGYSLDTKDKDLEKIFFDFGIELDDIYMEDGIKYYKLDIAANRYDLLCLEGLSTAIKTFLKIQKDKKLSIEKNKDVTVKKQKITTGRKYIACGIIKDLNGFDYESFIAYQDKLHSTVGRNRNAVAIGTHDYDKILENTSDKKVLIEYGEGLKEDVIIEPLYSCNNVAKKMKTSEFKNYLNIHLQKYLTDDKLCNYFVCKDKVMSVPPIINSEWSKIGEDSKNIFIEVTGTDKNRVEQVMKLMCLNFCNEKIQLVDVYDENGEKEDEIDFSSVTYTFTLNEIKRKTGLSVKLEEVKLFLEGMQSTVKILSEQTIEVTPHLIRMDIIDKCDIIEDILIAYGFERIKEEINEGKLEIKKAHTTGKENDLNSFTDKLREEMAFQTFNEVLTLTLLSKKENIFSEKAVEMSHAKSREYEVVRTSLLPGIFKSVSCNQNAKLPIKMFEVADVVVVEEESKDKKVNNKDEKVKNKRVIAGIYAGNSSKLEEIIDAINTLADKIKLDIKYVRMTEDINVKDITSFTEYKKNFVLTQAAYVFAENICIGVLGVLDSKVNKLFNVSLPMSGFEMDVEKIFALVKDKL